MVLSKSFNREMIALRALVKLKSNGFSMQDRSKILKWKMSGRSYEGGGDHIYIYKSNRYLRDIFQTVSYIYYDLVNIYRNLGESCR